MTFIQLSKEEILSQREFEVLERIALGHKNHEIAQSLGIAEVTVRFHIGNILSKLGVKNRTQAACYAIKNGWINT